MPIQGCVPVRSWAQQWVNLNSLVLGSAAYNAALQAITDQVVLRNKAPGKPNGSALNQLRLGRRSPDSLRLSLEGRAWPHRRSGAAADPGDAGGALKVWDLENGRELVTLQGHASDVTACAVTPDSQRVVSASNDQTLKVWDLKSGRMLVTLQGHSRPVTACAVTPDGQHIVSASSDQTLKVWNHESGECAFTHRASASFTAVVATATTSIAGDVTGGVWVLDRPLPVHNGRSFRGGHGYERPYWPHPDNESPSSRPRMQWHTILSLAADPSGTDRLALDREARAIQVELERSGFRDCFEFVTRWAAEPLDLLRELRKLKPTVVHFSGRSAPDIAGEPRPDPMPRHDIAGVLGYDTDPPRRGLFFQGSDGRPQLVSTDAIAETFGATGSSVQLVILSACHSNAQAKALLAHVDCVIGMSGSVSDAAARSFVIGFYGGLGEREPVAVAYEQGCAAISLEGLPDGDRPQLQIRAGIDANRLILAADPS